MKLSKIRHSNHQIYLDELNRVWDKRNIAPHDWLASLRFASEQCLGMFLYYLLGYTDINNEFHDEFIGWLEQGRDKDIYLVPRGHLKTSIFTIGGSLWSVIKNPERRIGIGSDTLGRAKGFLREIKSICENNPDLPLTWPEIFYQYPEKESPKWTENELVFKRRRTPKEASITAFSLESLPTGSHFEDIRLDDIVTPENTTTRDQMDKLKTSFGLLSPILEPQEAVMRVCGTRYDYGDLYGDLQKDPNWRAYRRPAIEDDKVIFPQKFTLEKLAEIRNDVGAGPYIFSCQYLLDPIDPENAMFQRRWFQYFTEWKPGPYNSYITVDTAYSEKRTADYSVIMHTKVDSQLNLFVTDYIRDRLAIGDLVNALLDMAERIPTLKLIGIEIQPGETENNSAMLHVLREEMRKRGKFHRLEAIKPVKDKVTRAGALVALFSNGQVYMRQNQSELEEELLRFPKGEHDDLVDALAYVPQLVHKPQRPKIPQPQPADPLIGYTLSLSICASLLRSLLANGGVA